MLKKKFFFTEFSRNYFWSSVLFFSKQGFLIYLILLSTFLLSKENFGYLGYSLAFSSFLVLFINFGISISVNKYVASYKLTNPSKLQTLLFPLLLYTIGAASIVSILTLFFFDSFFSIPKHYLYFLIPINFFLPLTSILDGFYKGLKEFKFLGIIYCGITLLLLPFSLFLVQTYKLEGSLLSYLLLYVSYFFFLFFFSFNYLKPNLFFKDSIPILKYGVLIGCMLLSYLLYIKADILLLGRYNHIEMIANYEIIQKLLEVLIIPFAIFSTVLTPTIIEYYEKKQIRYLHKKFKNSILLFLILSGIVVFLVSILFPILLKLFLPNYYSLEMMIIFNLGLFLIPLFILKQALFGTFIISTGHIFYIILPSLLFGFLNVVISSIVLQFSAISVIITTIVCLSLSVFTTIFFYYNLLRKQISSEENT